MSDGRVDFLVGGVQKGGTTALHQYLAQALPVSLARVKEAHFFSDETVDWASPDYAPYHALFEPDDGRPRGEATPIYLYWPDALERIAAYNPAMRLIFVFRDPVERAWSQWRMERARGFDDAPFSWAIREGRQRVADSTEKSGAHRVFSYVERGFYGAQLVHALTLFPAEQILVLRSEDLQDRPGEILSRVAQHLGVGGPRGALAPVRANVGETPPEGLTMSDEDARHLAGLFHDDLARFSALSGLDVSGWRAARDD